MTGILYFSSTGNSLYIAQRIRERIGGQVRYIPKYSGSGNEFEKLVIVTPIYSFGMPACVYDLLPRLDKKKDIVIVQNFGGMVGGADYYIYQYALRNGLRIKGVYTIKMPENYTLTFTMPKFYIKSILKKADKRIDRVISGIESEKVAVPRKKKTKEKTYLRNKSNWHLIGERFNVSEDCVKCGKCMEICPVYNIFLHDGKIAFADRCVACLGCYHRCPKKAIRYLNGKKSDRYINPNVHENQIGRDIESITTDRR